MKIPKTPVNADLWDEAVDKFLSKAWTRQQAAEHVGLSYVTFTNHLRYAKVDFSDKSLNRNLGSANARALEDPERHQRYIDATAHALRFGSVKRAADKYEVNYQVLTRKVRAAREKTKSPDNLYNPAKAADAYVANILAQQKPWKTPPEID